MESLWRAETKKPVFDTLQGDTKTDVLIIGGGIAGILCGYMLKKAGVDCLISEAKDICGGVTGNTTAKITYHHGAIFDKAVNRFGVEKGQQFIESQSRAIEEYERLSKSIGCDFSREDSFVYSLNNRHKIEKEVDALKKIGADVEFSERIPLPLSAVGAVCVKNQAQFNPLKLLYTLAKDLKIYENTKIIEVVGNGVITNRGRIKAEKIIVATHFPFINKYGGYFMKMYQHRSYVLALRGVPRIKGMYVDEADKGMSFRSCGDLLLIGGGDHRTGKKGGNWTELRAFVQERYLGAKEEYYWAAQDCITLDDLPYIGQYSLKTPNLFVSTGFNKWGMASAMTGAMLLADLVQGKSNDYAHLYSPSRSVLRPKLVLNALETTVSLVTPTVPRCPHLGCALKYNKAEHSWDCPCHGSRFSESGEVLDNPATEDKK